MPYLILKFPHVASMFLATALAVGPSVLLYLIARSGDVGAIRRALRHTTTAFTASGACYGPGLLFGFAAALSGSLDLASGWLLAAYVLIGLLIATNLVFERWARRIEHGLSEPGAGPARELSTIVSARVATYSLMGMVALTLLIVFVMVVKPAILG